MKRTRLLRRAAHRKKYHATQLSLNLSVSNRQSRRKRHSLIVIIQVSIDSTRSRTPGITRPETTAKVFNLAHGIGADTGRVHAVVRRSPRINAYNFSSYNQYKEDCSIYPRNTNLRPANMLQPPPPYSRLDQKSRSPTPSTNHLPFSGQISA